MNNIGDRYFATNRTAKILRYLSIILVVVGLAILFFAYGFGMLGIPIVILGGILYFACTSMTVSDKEYDRHMDDMLKTLNNDDIDSTYIKKWEFSAYGIGAKCKRGSDAKHRTDHYTLTRVFVSKTTITIFRYDINVSGNIERHEFESNIKDTKIKCITKEHLSTSFCYLEITSKLQDVFNFPVPYNNYDVEELLNSLTD